MTKIQKVKILKKLPKSKYTPTIKPTKKPAPQKADKFKDNYLNFYDDIKISSRRYDW